MSVAPFDRRPDKEPLAYRLTRELPPHLARWELPPGWRWGNEGVLGEHRHYQEVIDALGRSLSLVSVPDPAHAAWLGAEARHLAHRNHPSMPTTYHYWTGGGEVRRGPGYLRRWIAGETIGAKLHRSGPEDVPVMLRYLREVGSALAYLHDVASVHGAVSPDNVWAIPMGRIWLLGWQWALPLPDIPDALSPSFDWMPVAPEWTNGVWVPTPLTDQWQLAALCFFVLTGEFPPSTEVPPLQLIRPDCPRVVAEVLERALSVAPEDRYPSIPSMIRTIDRVTGTRVASVGMDDREGMFAGATEESRLRWALADDYEVLERIGAGSFGSVWRVRDLSLGREVALKLLHPHVTRDERAVGRFRREAQLAAQLAHPGIIPIFDWDSRGDVAWYTMELAEAGSVADLVARAGARPLMEIAPQVDLVLAGLAAAHSVGIIHRDLKPENILIDRYRRWRITDFGIANATGEEFAGTTGTPAFAAPEQLLGESQDAATDCFSLAAIVAFAMLGRPPFGSTEPKAILGRQLSAQVDLEGVPSSVADWLRRGLAPDQASRFTDAASMQRAWRAAVEEAIEDERRLPWWRRWLALEQGTPVWTVEQTT
ncbi:MAG: protein kinase domain-containing protein [Gemmatimonadaceae bacterium]